MNVQWLNMDVSCSSLRPSVIDWKRHVEIRVPTWASMVSSEHTRYMLSSQEARLGCMDTHFHISRIGHNIWVLELWA